MANQYPDGGNSSVIIGEGGQIDDHTDMDPVAYPVQDWNVNETFEPEEDPSLRASLAPNPPGPARLGVAGSFRISVLLNELLTIWKAITGDANAASVAVTDKVLADGTAIDATEVIEVYDPGDPDATPAVPATAGYFVDAMGDPIPGKNPDDGKSGRLEFTFELAAAVPDDGFIRITGLRKGGILDRHVFRHSETIDIAQLIADSIITDTTEAITSKKWFHQIRSVEILDSNKAAAAPTGMVGIISKPKSFVSSFELKQADINRLTIEAELAGIPHKLTEMIIAAATLNVAAGGNNLEVNVLGERMDELRSIESDIALEQFTSTREQHENDDPNPFPLVDPDFFPGFGGYLLIDGAPLLFRGATINFALNREVSEAIQGGPFSDDFESTGRAITATLPTYYQSGTLTSDNFIRWQDTLRNQEPIRAQIFLYAFTREGQEFVTEIDFPYALLTAAVDKNVNARSRVPIDLQIGAFPDPNVTDAPDVEIRVTGSDMLS